MTILINRTNAGYYDHFATGLDGDVSFYVDEACKTTGKVLELGCGTGRIMIPIAEAGSTIVGLDISPAMLETARSKTAVISDEARRRIQFVEDDIRTFKLDSKFDLVIIPYRTFLILSTSEYQRNTLSNIYDHLADGGRLIFNVFDPSVEEIAANSNSSGGTLRFVSSFRKPDTGNLVQVHESKRFSPTEQTLEWRTFIEENTDDGKVISKSCISRSLHYFYRFEMQYLLELCGFEVEALYGDFQRGPFVHGNEQIWIARKKTN